MQPQRPDNNRLTLIVVTKQDEAAQQSGVGKRRLAGFARDIAIALALVFANTRARRPANASARLNKHLPPRAINSIRNLWLVEEQLLDAKVDYHELPQFSGTRPSMNKSLSTDTSASITPDLCANGSKSLGLNAR